MLSGELSRDTVLSLLDGTIYNTTVNPAPEIATQGIPVNFNLDEHLGLIERSYLKLALDQTDGHVSTAAELLGLPGRTTRYRIAKYGLRFNQE